MEATTKQFSDIQAAYEVLSDPQERAWYDTHREQILRGDGTADSSQHPGHIITSEDILQILSKFHGRIDYNNSSTGFFGALADLFTRLAQEEEDAVETPEYGDAIQYPMFGSAEDTFEDTVRHFYAIWSSFATRKSFYWKDIYKYSQAPDRKIRRLMEKENKRIRDEAAREFNESVRSLIAFVKKRDPRYQPSKQSEAERQKALKDAAAAQAARSRAANQAKGLAQGQDLPDWMRSGAKEDSEFQEADWDSDQEAPKEEFECVLCNKTFKSEKQFEAHEKSKKHVKAAEQIKRQMQKENSDLNLDGRESTDTEDEAGTRPTDDAEELLENAEQEPHAPNVPLINHEMSPEETPEDDARAQDGDDSTSPTPPQSRPETVSQDPGSGSNTESETESDDDYAPREKIEARLQGQMPDHNSDQQVQDMALRLEEQSLDDDNDEGTSQPKKGKAKEKRAKKAAAAAAQQKASASANGNSSDFKCTTCQAGFPSKTRLFTHIKENPGHAQLVAPKQASSKSTKGKKR